MDLYVNYRLIYIMDLSKLWITYTAKMSTDMSINIIQQIKESVCDCESFNRCGIGNKSLNLFASEP